MPKRGDNEEKVHKLNFNTMKIGNFRTGALLVAGPTAGKSEFQSTKTQIGINLVDTDALQNNLFPEYNGLKMNRDRSATGDLLRKIMTQAIADDILLNHIDSLVVTNLWQPAFLKRLIGDQKPLIYVGLLDWKEMQERSRKRGVPMSEGLCRRMVARLTVEVPLAFSNFIFLPSDKYLSDVITIKNRSFEITPLGKQLLNAQPQRPGPFHDTKVEGGSHV
jgi:hypothetical protein